MNALHISGNDLTLENVREIAVERRAVLLVAEAREAVNRARAAVDALVANDQLAYAITTGVGKLSDVRIAGEQIRELQVNLVRSHAVGVGEPLAAAEVRAMMLLRHDLRDAESWRDAVRPFAGQRGCERRPRAARSSGAGVDRRRRVFG
jgi:histidine ammonia-lyase